MADYVPNMFQEYQYADIDKLIDDLDIQTPPIEFEQQIMLDQFASAVNPVSIPAVANVSTPYPGKASSNFNPNVDYSTLDSKESIDNYFAEIVSQPDPLKDMEIKPIRFGYESVNFDRYAAHGNFNKLGFHPYRDNERIYNANSTWFDDFGRAFVQMGKLTYTGFVSAYRSLGDFFDDSNNYLVGKDLDSSREFEKAIRVGETTRGGLGEFFTNLGLQFGYTGGIMLSIAVEEFALAALTRGTSLGTSGLRQGAKVASLGEQIARSTMRSTPLRYAENARDLTTSLNSVDKAKGFWESVNAGENFLGKLILPETMQTLRLLNTKKAAVQNMSNMAKSYKTFGGFYRDMRSFNYAISEAKMEGGMNYDRGMQANLDIMYKNNNGQPLTDEQMETVKLNASARGAWTTGINAPIIYLSNQFLLGNAFGSWNRSFARFIGEKSNDVLTRITRSSPLKKGEIGANFRLLDKGAKFKRLQKLRSEGLGAFAKGTFKKTLGGSLRYFAGNFSEGIQEVSQEATAFGVGSYYEAILEDPLKGGVDLATASILSGISSQMNAQGFEVFMSGFLMGSIAQVPQKFLFQSIPNIKNRLLNKEEFARIEKNREDSLDQIKTALNEVFEAGVHKDGDYFDIDKAIIANFFAQKQTSETLQDNVTDENSKAVHDNKDDSKFFQLYTVFETNTENLLRDQIRDYQKLSDEDLVTAIPTNKTEGATKVRERLTSFLNTIDNFEELYYERNDKLVNPYNPSFYDKDTEEYANELQNYKSYEFYRRLAVFTDFNLTRQNQRMANLFSDLETNELFKDMSAGDITVLLTPDSLLREISTLQNEILTLDEKEDADLILKKKQKAVLLKRINDKLKVDDNNKIILDEPTKDFLKVNIALYIKDLATQKGQVQYKDLTETIEKIIDFYELSNEEKAYALTAQNLANPQIMLETVARINDVIKKLGIRNISTDDVTGAIADYIDLQVFNKLINELADIGIYADPNQIMQFKKDNFNPEYLTMWYKNGAQLLEDDADYDAVKNLKQIFRDAYNKKKADLEAKQEAQEKKEEASKATDPISRLKNTIGDSQFEIYRDNISKLIIEDAKIEDPKYIANFYSIGVELYEAAGVSDEDFIALNFDMEAAINNLDDASKQKIDIDDQNIKDIIEAQKTFGQEAQEEQDQINALKRQEQTEPVSARNIEAKQKELNDIKEIASFGETYEQAQDSIIAKQYELRKIIREKEIKEKGIGNNQFTTEELESLPERKEDKRLDKLVDKINVLIESYGVSAKVSDHVAIVEKELAELPSRRKRKKVSDIKAQEVTEEELEDEAGEIKENRTNTSDDVYSKLENNRRADGRVVGGKQGWKIRLNLKDLDADYQKVVDWLDKYFETTQGKYNRIYKGANTINYYGFGESSMSVWKLISGGEINASEFTIYIGSKADTLKFIEDVKSSEIAPLLDKKKKANTDVELADSFYGRVDMAGTSKNLPSYNQLGVLFGKKEEIIQDFEIDGESYRIVGRKGKRLSDPDFVSIIRLSDNKVLQARGKQASLQIDKEFGKDFINKAVVKLAEIAYPEFIGGTTAAQAQQTTEEVQDQKERIEPRDGAKKLELNNSEYAAFEVSEGLYELVGVDTEGYFRLPDDLFKKGMPLEGKRILSKQEYQSLFAKGDEKIREESDYRKKVIPIGDQTYFFGDIIYRGTEKFAFLTFDDESQKVEIVQYDKYEAFENSDSPNKLLELLSQSISIDLGAFSTMSKIDSKAAGEAIADELEYTLGQNKIDNVTIESNIDLESEYESIINQLINNGDLTADVYATFTVILEDSDVASGTQNLFQTEENSGNSKIKQTNTGKRLKFVVPQSLIDTINKKYGVDVGDVFGYINLDTLQFQTNTGAVIEVSDMTLAEATDYFSTAVLKGDNAQEYFNLFKESHRAKRYLVNNIGKLENREYTLQEFAELMNMRVDTRSFSKLDFADERVAVEELPVNTYTNANGEEITLIVKSTYNPTTGRFVRQKLQDTIVFDSSDVDVDALNITHGYVLITNESPGGKVVVRPLITKSIPKNELVEFLNEQLKIFRESKNIVQVNNNISDKIFIRSIAGAYYTLTLNDQGEYLISFNYRTKDKITSVEPVVIVPQDGVINADQIEQAIDEINNKTASVPFAYNPQQRNLGATLQINLKSFSRGFPKDANASNIIENSETIGVKVDAQSVHLRLNDKIDDALVESTQDQEVTPDRSDIQKNNRNTLLKRKRELEDEIEALESLAMRGPLNQQEAFILAGFKTELEKVNEDLANDDIAFKLVESEYTPEDVENLDRFIEYLDRILPPEMVQVVGLQELSQRLIDGNVVVGAFRLQLQKLAEGMTLRGKIYTSKDSPDKYHEAFHAVFRMLLTPQELKQYYRIAKKELKKKLGNQYGKQLEIFINSTRRYSELSKKQVPEYGMSEAELRFLEEYMADEFDKFKMNPKSTKTDSFIKSLFNKILEIIKAIFNTSTKNELNTLFENIDAGKFRTRTNIDNRFTELAYRGDTEIIPALIPYNSKKKLTSDATSYVVGNVYANTVAEIDRGTNLSLDEILDGQIESFVDRQQIVANELFNQYKSLPADKAEQNIKSLELQSFIRAEKILNALKLDEAKKIIKEQVKDRLAQIKIQVEATQEEFQEQYINIGVKQAGTFSRNSEGLGGISSLPLYWRVLFSTTFYETKNELGQTMMLPVEPAVIYDGFMAALVDVEGSLNKLRQLVIYSDSGNAQTNAVVNKLLKTVNLTREFITNPETTQQDFEDYINDPMSGITSEQKIILQKFFITFDHTRSARIVTKIDKDGIATVEDLSLSGSIKYQMDSWLDANTKKQGNMRMIGRDYYNEAVSKMLGQEKKGPRTNEKIISDTLNVLYSFLATSRESYQQNMAVFNKNEYTEYRALMNISTGISQNISEILGINISPMFIAYSILKQGDAGKSADYKLQTLVQSKDVFPIIPDTVEQIRNIIESNKTEGVNVSLFDSIKGVRGRLRSIASGNALFDETVPATTLRNAEDNLIYGYQRKTLMSRFVAEIVRTGGENLKQDTDEFLKNNYLMNSDEFQLLVETGQLKLEQSEGVQEVDGYKVLDGTSYGNMKPTDFLTHLINLYMSSVNREGQFINPELAFQTSKILLRVLESSNKGQIISLPVIKGYDIVEGKKQVSVEAMKAFIMYVGAEMNRIQKVSTENTSENIVNYNTLEVTNENTNEKEYIEVDNEVKDDEVKRPNGYKLFKTKDLINNKPLVNALESLARKSNEELNEMFDTEDINYDFNDYSTLLLVLEKAELEGIDGNPLALLKESINATIQNSINEIIQTIEDNNLRGGINKFFLEGSNSNVNSALNLKNNDLEFNMGQFVVSNYINSFSFNNLLYGDAALSFKNVMDQVVRGKTASADFIPAYSEIINPELGITQQFKEFDLIPMSSSLVESLFTGQNIKDNDSILYMSTMATRYVEHGLSRLDKSFADIITKIEKNQRLTGSEVFDENGLVERAQMLNPKKYIYADNKTLLKMSAITLTPELDSIPGTNEPDPARIVLYNLRMALENYQRETGRIAVLAPVDTIKKLKKNVQSFTALASGNLQVDQNSVTKLDTSYFGLQQVNPSNKKTISSTTQIIALLTTRQDPNEVVIIDGVEKTVGEIIEAFNKSEQNTVELRYLLKKNLSFENALKIGKDLEINFSKQKLESIAPFLAYAQNSLRASTTATQELEFLEFTPDGNIKYDINNPLIISKIQDLLVSYFSKEVLKQTLPGTAFTLTPDMGVRIYRMVYSTREVTTDRGTYFVPDKSDVIRRDVYFADDQLRNQNIAFHIDMIGDVMSAKIGADSNLEGLKEAVEKSEGKGVLIIDRLRYDQPQYIKEGDPSTWKPTGQKRTEGLMSLQNKQTYNYFEKQKAVSVSSLEKLYNEWKNSPVYDRRGYTYIPVEMKNYDENRGRKAFARQLKIRYKINEEKNVEFLPLTLSEIPEALRESFTVRIPTSAEHQAMAVDFVDFLPVFYGNAAAFAREMIEASGADFDIDTAYAHFAEYYYNNRTFVRYGDNQADEFLEYITYTNDAVKKKGNALSDAVKFYKKDYLRAEDLLDEYFQIEVNNVRYTKDALIALGVLGLPVTREQYNKFKELNGFSPNMGILNNEKLKNKMALLGNAGMNTESNFYIDEDKTPVRSKFAPTVTGKPKELKVGGTLSPIAYSQTSTDLTEAIWEEFKEEFGKDWAKEIYQEEQDVDNPASKIKSYEGMHGGVRSIGSSVLPNSTLDQYSQHGIRLDKSGQNPTAFTIDGFTYYRYDTIKSIIPKLDGSVEYGSTIQDVKDELIQIMVDDKQLRLAARFNLNSDTLAMVMNMIALGVPLKTSLLLFSNKMIRNLYSSTKTKDLKDELQLRINELENSLGKDAEGIQERSITTQDLIDTVNPKNNDVRLQNLKILKFVQHQKKMSEFNYLIGELISQQKGLKSFEDFNNIESSVQKLSRGFQSFPFQLIFKPQDYKDDSGKLKNSKYTYKQLPKTIYAKLYEVYEDQRLNVFPQILITRSAGFVDFFNYVKKHFAFTRKKTNEKLERDILSYLTIKAYEHKNVGNIALGDLSNSMLYPVGDRSIVTEIERIVEERGLENNLFLSRFLTLLPIDDVNNFIGIDQLRASIPRGSEANKIDFQNSFLELYNNPTTRDLANKIVHYLMVSQGLQPTYNSISGAITPVVIENYLDVIGTVFNTLQTLPTENLIIQGDVQSEREKYFETFGATRQQLLDEFVKYYFTSSYVFSNYSDQYSTLENEIEDSIFKMSRERAIQGIENKTRKSLIYIDDQTSDLIIDLYSQEILPSSTEEITYYDQPIANASDESQSINNVIAKIFGRRFSFSKGQKDEVVTKALPMFIIAKEINVDDQDQVVQPSLFKIASVVKVQGAKQKDFINNNGMVTGIAFRYEKVEPKLSRSQWSLGEMFGSVENGEAATQAEVDNIIALIKQERKLQKEQESKDYRDVSNKVTTVQLELPKGREKQIMDVIKRMNDLKSEFELPMQKFYSKIINGNKASLNQLIREIDSALQYTEELDVDEFIDNLKCKF